MDRNRTIGQVAFVIASLLLPATASAANCNAGTFAAFVACAAAGGLNDTITLTATVQPDGTDVVVNADQTVLNNGFTLDGTGLFSKKGAGALGLPAANTFTGAATIWSGTLFLGNQAALGGLIGMYGGSIVATTDMTLGDTFDIEFSAFSGSSLAAANGTTLQVGRIYLQSPLTWTLGDPVFNGTVVLLDPSNIPFGANDLILGGGTVIPTIAGANVFASQASVTISPTATLDLAGHTITIANIAGSGTIFNNGPGDLVIQAGTWGGMIHGPGKVLKTSGGTLILQSVNPYFGPTEVAAGVLQIGLGGQLGSGAISIAPGAQLIYDSFGPQMISAPISGNGLLMLQSGNLRLTGTNTFSGSTLVNAGTLEINGSHAFSPITLNGSSVLYAQGATGNLTVNNVGNLRVGTFPVGTGALSTGSLTLTGSATGVSFEINGPAVGSGYDQIAVTGTVSPGNANLLVNGTYAPLAGETFVLIANDGTDSIAGSFIGVPEGGGFTLNGVPMVYSYVGGPGGNDFVVSVLTRTVTPSVVPNGTIAPSTPTPVIDGRTATFTITADVGYHAVVIGTCPAGAFTPPGSATYVTGNVTANCTVDPVFVINTYSVTTSGGGVNGNITPPSQPVNHGSTAAFTVTPAANYSASFGGTCPIGALVGPTYTTGTITAACNVAVTFVPNSYAVTSSGSNANGTITPPSQPVNHGSPAAFTVTPSAGYTASFGGTCPTGALVGPTYTTGTITAACNVAVTFTLNSYGVTSSGGGANGTITPPSQPVNHGTTAAFTVTPSAGYTASFGGTCPIGSLVGPTYTTGTITAACDVAVTFTLNGYTVTSSGGGANGTITPPSQSVNHGSTAAFTVTPAAGYTASFGGTCPIGALVGPTYTTGTITAACNVAATFTQNTYSVTMAASPLSGGTVSCSPNPVPHGGTTTCTATANSAFEFVAWSGDCTGATCTLSNVVSARNVTATFKLIPRLVNIAARAPVLTGDDVLIGGFVIGGSATKRVAVVATGPSLSAFGISNPLANPMITLIRSSDQAVIGSSDDWQTAANAADLTAAGFAPSNILEAAILADLAPGAYTAIVQGVGGGTGVSVLGVYEVGASTVPLVNISSRGRVQGGDNVMIGSFVISGTGSQTLAIVGTGPSLSAFGVASPLANPTLTIIRSSDQVVLATNNDWQADANASLLQAAGLAPSNPLESAIYITLPPGAYTAILSGVGGGTGVGVIGVYKLN